MNKSNVLRNTVLVIASVALVVETIAFPVLMSTGPEFDTVLCVVEVVDVVKVVEVVALGWLCVNKDVSVVTCLIEASNAVGSVAIDVA